MLKDKFLLTTIGLELRSELRKEKMKEEQ